MYRTYRSVAVVAILILMPGCADMQTMFDDWARANRTQTTTPGEKDNDPAEESATAQTPAAEPDEPVAALDPDTQKRIEQYLERFPDNELAQKLARSSDPPPLKKNTPNPSPNTPIDEQAPEADPNEAPAVVKTDEEQMPAESTPETKKPLAPEPVAIVKVDPDQIKPAKNGADDAASQSEKSDAPTESPAPAPAPAPSPAPEAGSNRPMEVKPPAPPEEKPAPQPAEKPVVKKVGIVQPDDISPPPAEPAPKTNKPVTAAAPSLELTLDDLIAGLEKKVTDAPNDIEAQFKLRFLYAATGKNEKAAAVTDGMDQDMSEFLQRMFVAVSDAEKAAKDPVTGADKALDSLDDLRQIVRRYAQLRIPRLKICRKVDSYGVFEALEPPVFFAQQGNRVIVYCEVKNFASEKTPDGLYKTQLSQRLEILTPNSHSEWKMEDENIVDVSRNRREDFFIIQIIDLPNSLAAGKYILKVSVVDKLSNRAQEEFIEFTMKDATAGSSSSAGARTFAEKPQQ